MPNRDPEGANPAASAAEALATRLLHPLDGRLAHSATVAAQIERTTGLIGTDWRSPARDAAWLHDIGYHPDLALSGFRPLDGARWLREHQWPSQTCQLVAWHTQSFEEAQLYGLATVLAAEFDPPPPLVASALAWADLTSSPNGERWDAERRLAEILDRYPPGSIVHDATPGIGGKAAGIHLADRGSTSGATPLGVDGAQRLDCYSRRASGPKRNSPTQAVAPAAQRTLHDCGGVCAR